MRLICVDDEELVLDLVRSMCLNLPQHPEVYAFSGAAKALDFIKDNTVDIALLDINMPDMNGLTLAAKIKEESPDTAIVFLIHKLRAVCIIEPQIKADDLIDLRKFPIIEQPEQRSCPCRSVL